MQDLKITLVQADQAWEDREENFKRYDALLKNQDSDLFVLPEMFQTGFSMNTSLCERMNGISIQWLRERAAMYNAAFYTSLMIEENGAHFNRGVFVHPDGTIHSYDKRKCFRLAGEDKHFTSGKSATIVEFRGWKFQLQICYDLRFPKIVQNEIVDGDPIYDIILYVANWPAKRIAHWDALLKARAIENQSYVVGVNRIGTDGNGFEYNGHSTLIDAMGEINDLLPNQSLAKTVVIHCNEITKIRERLPFLSDL